MLYGKIDGSMFVEEVGKIFGKQHQRVIDLAPRLHIVIRVVHAAGVIGQAILGKEAFEKNDTEQT